MRAKTLVEMRMETMVASRDDLVELGRGAFSTVFATKNPNEVIKFVRRGDKEYKKFINLIEEEASPHFPKIYFMEDYGDEGQIYTLEKLYPLPSKDMYKAFAIDNYVMGNIIRPAEKAFLEQSPSLVEALDYLKQKVETPNRWDVSYNNLMYRYEGLSKTLVITDPWSY